MSKSPEHLSSHKPQSGRRARWVLPACVLLGLMSWAANSAPADELYLRDGFVLKGTAVPVQGLNLSTAKRNNTGPVPNTSYWMVDDGVRRFFVFRRQLAAPTEEIAELSGQVTYKPQQTRTGSGQTFSIVGAFSSVGPFDQFGRRTVSLPTSRGPVDVVQAITEMRPDYTQLSALNKSWDYAIDTDTLPPDVIQAIIQQSSNRDDLNERKVAVQFYLQAGMIPQAQHELSELASRAPELSEWCKEFELRINELIARRGINEIQRRREAGQHLLAYNYSRQFPEQGVSSGILRQARTIVEEYDAILAERERLLMLLDSLQAKLPMETAQRLHSLRVKLLDELHIENVTRLDPFFRSADDETLTPSERLALAYSGWLLGGANAILDLDATIELWDARFLVLEYLRTERNPGRDRELLDQLRAIEALTVERLSWMIPLMPMPFELTGLTPGVATEQVVPYAASDLDIRYTLMLPPEYDDQHHYPLLVVLRREGSSFEDELHWWAGDQGRPGWAQRRGYIVIAPHYCDEEATDFHGTFEEHEIVMRSIDHVRRRLRVDSDRIFLAGHGMGADACFDLGMSHPGEFAGVIPITGRIDKYCRAYWENAPNLSWYIVSGEKDRDTLENNAPILNNMMNRGQDVIVCDYKSRGFETYHEELERIFEWMRPVRRVPLSEVSRFEISTLRLFENRFHWMQARAIPKNLFPPVAWNTSRPRLPNRKLYKANFTPTGTIYLNHPGDETTLWLSPELFDFENRCRISANSRQVFNDYVTPSIEDMLTDLRERGDRERLFWARLDF